MNDLRCDTLKRIKSSDNQQYSTKEHFHQLDTVDKCQSGGNITSSFNGSTVGVVDYDYNNHRALKEPKPYFIDHATNRMPSYAVNGDKLVNHSHEGFVTDYDDTISMNGDNSKEYIVSSSGNNGGNVVGTNNNMDNGRTNHRNAKRKHLNDGSGGGGGGDDAHKMYKNNCGDTTAMMPNKFDYMSNFDGSGIRPRSFDEIQNERMMEATENEYRIGGNAETSVDDMNGGRCTDERNGNMINYASSDDLNQTNTSEHDEKNLSASDDESGGKFGIFFTLFRV